MTAAGRRMHTSCFTCRGCDGVIQPGEAFTVEDEGSGEEVCIRVDPDDRTPLHAYHIPCHRELFAARYTFFSRSHLSPALYLFIPALFLSPSLHLLDLDF